MEKKNKNTSLHFRLRKIDEQRNYFLEEINLLLVKNIKNFQTLNYIEHQLILASTVTGCISIVAIAYLVGVPAGIIIKKMKKNLIK